MLTSGETRDGPDVEPREGVQKGATERAVDDEIGHVEGAEREGSGGRILLRQGFGGHVGDPALQ